MSEKVLPFKFAITDYYGFTRYFQELLNNRLNDFVSRSTLSPKLEEVVRYVLFPGGKRIRPLTAAALISDFKQAVEPIVDVTIGLELLHNASLIHDDLPALDDDNFRRGKATCHVAYGEALAILAGDAMVALAQESVLNSKLDLSQKLKIAKLHTKAFTALCNGQQQDISGVESKAKLLKLHEEKTGSLFAAALCSTGVFLNFDDQLLSICYDLGLNLGVYFQLVDDTLDVFGSDSERGRMESSDKRNNKQTLFTLEDMHTAVASVKKQRDNLERLVSLLEQTANKRRSLTLFRQLLSTVDKRYDQCLSAGQFASAG